MKSKLLFLLLSVVALISCNDDDYTPPIDYRQYIEFKNSSIRSIGLNTLEFQTTIQNRSSKNLTLDVIFTSYLNDNYQYTNKIERVKIASGEVKRINYVYPLPHFSYQNFVVKDLKCDVIKVD